MNASSLEKLSIDISNGWIIGCSILTFGIITCAYLNGVSNIPLINMKRKYRLELKQIENSINLSEKKNLKCNKLTSLVPFTKIDEDSDDDLDDDSWVAKKKDFWKKNNISPIIVKGGHTSPSELSNLLAETFHSSKK